MKQNKNKTHIAAIITKSELKPKASWIGKLRQELSSRLERVIDQSSIREKELKAFDRLVSRRGFLRGGAKISLFTGLVASGLVPTRWALARPDVSSLKIDPSEVGLTPEEMAQVKLPAAIMQSSELYSDVVYAKSATVSKNAGLHGVLEGLQLQAKMQSRPGSLIEETLADRHHHYGATELVQFAKNDDDEGWALEHYVHERQSRFAKDGNATTQGYQREVIAWHDFPNGLDKPVLLKAITHPGSNSLQSGRRVSGCWWLFVQSERLDQSYIMIRTKSYHLSFDAEGRQVVPTVDDSGWQMLPLSEILSSLGYSTDKVSIGSVDVNYNYDGTGQLWLSLPRSGSQNQYELVAYVDISGKLHVSLHDYLNDASPLSEVKSSLLQVSGIKEEAQGSSTDSSLQGVSVLMNLGSAAFANKGDIKINQALYRYEFDKLRDRQVNGHWIRGYTTSKGVYQENVGVSGRLANVYTVSAEGAQMGVHFANESDSGGELVLFALTARGYEQIQGMPCADLSGAGDPIAYMSMGASKYGRHDGETSYPLYRCYAVSTSGNVYLLPQAEVKDSDSETYGTPISFEAQYQSQTYSYPSFAEDNETEKSSTVITHFLGNDYLAVYTGSRFRQNSEYVMIKADGAYIGTNKYVENSWKTEAITQQQELSEEDLNNDESEPLSGSFYHVELSVVNVYGSPVSLRSSQQVEIRSTDSLKVIDECTQTYHEIDRSSSALFSVDPSVGKVLLMVKGQSLSCPMMYRLVNLTMVSLSQHAFMQQFTNLDGVPVDWCYWDLADNAQARTTASYTTDEDESPQAYVSQETVKGTGVKYQSYYTKDESKNNETVALMLQTTAIRIRPNEDDTTPPTTEIDPLSYSVPIQVPSTDDPDDPIKGEADPRQNYSFSIDAVSGKVSYEAQSDAAQAPSALKSGWGSLGKHATHAWRHLKHEERKSLGKMTWVVKNGMSYVAEADQYIEDQALSMVEDSLNFVASILEQIPYVGGYLAMPFETLILMIDLLMFAGSLENILKLTDQFKSYEGELFSQDNIDCMMKGLSDGAEEIVEDAKKYFDKGIDEVIEFAGGNSKMPTLSPAANTVVQEWVKDQKLQTMMINKLLAYLPDIDPSDFNVSDSIMSSFTALFDKIEKDVSNEMKEAAKGYISLMMDEFKKVSSDPNVVLVNNLKGVKLLGDSVMDSLDSIIKDVCELAPSAVSDMMHSIFEQDIFDGQMPKAFRDFLKLCKIDYKGFDTKFLTAFISACVYWSQTMQIEHKNTGHVSLPSSFCSSSDQALLMGNNLDAGKSELITIFSGCYCASQSVTNLGLMWVLTNETAPDESKLKKLWLAWVSLTVVSGMMDGTATARLFPAQNSSISAGLAACIVLYIVVSCFRSISQTFGKQSVLSYFDGSQEKYKSCLQISAITIGLLVVAAFILEMVDMFKVDDGTVIDKAYLTTICVGRLSNFYSLVGNFYQNPESIWWFLAGITFLFDASFSATLTVDAVE